jgi:hypothetical protein
MKWVEFDGTTLHLRQGDRSHLDQGDAQAHNPNLQGSPAAASSKALEERLCQILSEPFSWALDIGEQLQEVQEAQEEAQRKSKKPRSLASLYSDALHRKRHAYAETTAQNRMQ